MIKAVIVEDEKIAQEILADYIKRYCPSIQLVGVASNIHDAVPMIHECRPEVVFLDVEMPFGNGFDVLDACREVPFETIFITAYAEYAIKAINKAAAYYLLKPVNIEELIIAVEKVKTNIESKQQINRNKILLENLQEKKPELHQLVLPTLEDLMSSKQKMSSDCKETEILRTSSCMENKKRWFVVFSNILKNCYLIISSESTNHISSISNLSYPTTKVQVDMSRSRMETK